jgi:hypothetical protein
MTAVGNLPSSGDRGSQYLHRHGVTVVDAKGEILAMHDDALRTDATLSADTEKGQARG